MVLADQELLRIEIQGANTIRLRRSVVVKYICIVCKEVFRSEDDGKEETIESHGICMRCLEERKSKKQVKKTMLTR